jgi:hypothetical protein
MGFDSIHRLTAFTLGVADNNPHSQGTQMLTFYVYRPHGSGWKRLINEQATSYQAAARQVHQRTGAKRVKVEGEDAAAQANMNYQTRIINFNK